MSDPLSGEAASAPQVGGAAPDARPGVGPPRGPARRRVLAGAALLLVAVAVALIASDPFGGTAQSGGVSDNATATSLATVQRRSLSSQMQVPGTLGFAGSSTVRVPSGTSPSAVQQVGQQLTSAGTTLASARATQSSDARTLAGHNATLAAARAKEQVDCAGTGAAEAGSTASSPAGENGSPSAGAASCASDVQAVSSAQQNASGDAAKLTADRSQVASAERQLASARASFAAARSSAAVYGQSSTFTKLPSAGQIFTQGESLYEIDRQPVVLLYGSVIPTRAFAAGMSAGPDVAELNADLDALGYGQSLTGDTFGDGTGAAIRAFQSAQGMSVTGALLLGSVVFEPGPVRVTSVTPATGQPVLPGPVLGVTSTARQVEVKLDAAQQASVKVGDAATITLPDNQATPGRITYVSSVATSPPGAGSGGGGGEEESAPTIAVDVTPTEPAATGHLDQAPVNVSITSESVQDALAVPIDALLALSEGGYALEVAEGRTHRLEAVSLGLFDDADGLVQVSGQGVSAGQRVVVPATS